MMPLQGRRARDARESAPDNPRTWPVAKAFAWAHGLGDPVLRAYAEGRRRGVELSRMRYADYLNTPEWGATRRQVLEDRDNRCESCGFPDNLQVHHLTYVHRGDERASELRVLCDACHEDEHLAQAGRPPAIHQEGKR
jgi:hypothetical protein